MNAPRCRMTAALTLAGLALAAAPAQAADVESGTLGWTSAAVYDSGSPAGTDRTWLGYVTGPGFLGNGTATPSDGATGDTVTPLSPRGPETAYTWSYAATSGTYDAATDTGTIELDGTVTFNSPGHGFTVTVTDPRIVLDGDQGTLYASGHGGGTAGTPTYDRTQPVFDLNLAGATRTETADGLQITGIVPSLATADYVFPANYAAGAGPDRTPNTFGGFAIDVDLEEPVADISATPAADLDPAGATVTVTGSGIPLTTGTPPGTGLYAAQMAIIGGTTYVANNAQAKFVRRNPTGSANQAKLEDDGSFSTTVAVAGSFTSGTTTVDCAAAGTDCFIASWPAHGNPSAANVIDKVALDFAWPPKITATPTTDLDPAGETVTVTGSDIPLNTGTPPGTGLYAAQMAIVDGTTYVASDAAAKFVRRNPSGSANQAKLEDDGSFSTTVAVVQGWGTGASAVDCTAANTACFIASWPAHGNPTAANVIDKVAIEFADDPGPGPGPGPGPSGAALSVSPTSGLPTDGPSTVTVTGSGYPTDAPGLYVVYGPLAGNDRDAYHSGAKFLASSTIPGGSFSTTLTVAPTYTTTAGQVVNCTVVQCYVQTMRAHGTADPSGAWNRIVPIAFGTTVATPEPDLVAPPTEAPTPVTPGGSAPSGSAPAAAPELARVRLGDEGRISLRVSEASTVTFEVRRKVNGRWKVVKRIEMKTDGAGLVARDLPVGKPGRYRVTISAVGTESGVASEPVVKKLRVKADDAGSRAKGKKAKAKAGKGKGKGKAKAGKR